MGKSRMGSTSGNRGFLATAGFRFGKSISGSGEGVREAAALFLAGLRFGRSGSGEMDSDSFFFDIAGFTAVDFLLGRSDEGVVARGLGSVGRLPRLGIASFRFGRSDVGSGSVGLGIKSAEVSEGLG